MAAIKESVEIEAPADRVWAVVHEDFKNAGKFTMRYSELGFNEPAKLDSGGMWPTVFAVTKLTAADEAKITKLVKKAVG